MIEENEFEDFDSLFEDSIDYNSSISVKSEKYMELYSSIYFLLKSNNEELTSKQLETKRKYIARLFVLYHLITDERNLNDEYEIDLQGNYIYELDRSTGKPYRKTTGRTYLTCSTDQMRVYVSTYAPYVDYLRQELRYIKKIKQGGPSEGMSHYQKRDEWGIDVSDEHIQYWIGNTKENPTKIWNKTNEPSGFSINRNLDVRKVLIRSQFESEKHFEERIKEIESSIYAINSGSLGAYRGHKSTSGREYSVFSNLPREIRDYLLYMGGASKIVNIDINATIPRLMGFVCKSIITSRINKELKMLAISKNLHKAWINNGYIDGDGSVSNLIQNILDDIEKYNCLVDEGDTYMNIINVLGIDVTRQELKDFFLKIAFGTLEDDIKHITRKAISKALMEKFPALMVFIKEENQEYRLLKKRKQIGLMKGYFTSRIFQLESTILKGASKQFKEYPRLTLHDGIYTLEKYQEEIKEAFEESFIKHTSLKVRIKIESMEAKETIDDLVSRLKLRKCVKNGIEFYRKKIKGKDYYIKKDASFEEIQNKFIGNVS